MNKKDKEQLEVQREQMSLNFDQPDQVQQTHDGHDFRKLSVFLEDETLIVFHVDFDEDVQKAFVSNIGNTKLLDQYMKPEDRNYKGLERWFGFLLGQNHTLQYYADKIEEDGFFSNVYENILVDVIALPDDDDLIDRKLNPEKYNEGGNVGDIGYMYF